MLNQITATTTVTSEQMGIENSRNHGKRCTFKRHHSTDICFISSQVHGKYFFRKSRSSVAVCFVGIWYRESMTFARWKTEALFVCNIWCLPGEWKILVNNSNIIAAYHKVNSTLTQHTEAPAVGWYQIWVWHARERWIKLTVSNSMMRIRHIDDCLSHIWRRFNSFSSCEFE